MTWLDRQRSFPALCAWCGMEHTFIIDDLVELDPREPMPPGYPPGYFLAWTACPTVKQPIPISIQSYGPPLQVSTRAWGPEATAAKVQEAHRLGASWSVNWNRGRHAEHRMSDPLEEVRQVLPGMPWCTVTSWVNLRTGEVRCPWLPDLLQQPWDLLQLRQELAMERAQLDPFAGDLAAFGCW